MLYLSCMSNDGNNFKLVQSVFLFYQKAVKLKSTTRHSWLPDSDRQESVAEHSWMLTLLAVTLFDMVSVKVNQLHVLKMLIIHDLAETVIGDIPAHEISARQNGKYKAEQAAMKLVVSDLPQTLQFEILDLWEEFEARQTPEAELAASIDKIEALMQHDLASLSTWDEGDYRILSSHYKNEFFDFDDFMRQLKNEMDKRLDDKVRLAEKN